MSSVYKLGDIVGLLGHKLKVIGVHYSNFGYTYKLSCYDAGCCSTPFILKMIIHENDLVEYGNKNND